MKIKKYILTIVAFYINTHMSIICAQEPTTFSAAQYPTEPGCSAPVIESQKPLPSQKRTIVASRGALNGRAGGTISAGLGVGASILAVALIANNSSSSVHSHSH